MEFYLYPVTLNYWGNYYVEKWDIYARENPMGFRLLHTVNQSSSDNMMMSPQAPIPLFKTDNMEDYKRFRSMFQVLDLALLDLECYRHEKLKIVASAVYL